MRLIGMNMGEVVAGEVLCGLWNNYTCSNCSSFGSDSTSCSSNIFACGTITVRSDGRSPRNRDVRTLQKVVRMEAASTTDCINCKYCQLSELDYNDGKLLHLDLRGRTPIIN